MELQTTQRFSLHRCVLDLVDLQKLTTQKYKLPLNVVYLEILDSDTDYLKCLNGDIVYGDRYFLSYCIELCSLEKYVFFEIGDKGNLAIQLLGTYRAHREIGTHFHRPRKATFYLIKLKDGFTCWPGLSDIDPPTFMADIFCNACYI